MSKPIHYKRSRFSTYLPTDRLYSASHFWLLQDNEGCWTIGFTKFATRMLGEIVECNFELNPQAEVQVGQVIGNLEAFKAVTDLYCVIEGVFKECNSAIENKPNIVSDHPYDKGWLYKATGKPDEDCMAVHGYIEYLNDTIDRLQAEEKESAHEPIE